jgi:hypothetical protein
MPIYCCQTCGKRIDPDKEEICPACGTAVAPSVLTRVERKRTAARLRAEGMTHYDDHCHDEDSWRGSYGAQAHRAAVRSHEENLRAGYRAHSTADVTVRGTGAPAAQVGNGGRKQEKRKRGHLGLILIVAFLPILLMIFGRIISSIFELLREVLGGGISFYP